jgi:HPt (histidine-containing phosphotransfer) domain-containing protein
MHIKRAAHVIKGASSNLMCQPLRTAAANLEKGASKGCDASKNRKTEDVDPAWENVKELIPFLRKVTDNYHSYIQSIGV